MKVKIKDLKGLMQKYKNLKLHAMSIYTQAGYLKITWEISKSFKLPEDAYEVSKDGIRYMVIKLSGDINPDQVKRITGYDYYKCYFADQYVYRFKI